jgi:hypothetical protein
MGKRERERKGWRGLLYPLTQKRVITALRSRMFGKIPETREVGMAGTQKPCTGLHCPPKAKKR